MGTDIHVNVEVLRPGFCLQKLALALCWRRLLRRWRRRSGKAARSRRRHGPPCKLGLLLESLVMEVASFLQGEQWQWVPAQQWKMRGGPLSEGLRSYELFELLAGARTYKNVRPFFTDGGVRWGEGWPCDISPQARRMKDWYHSLVCYSLQELRGINWSEPLLARARSGGLEPERPYFVLSDGIHVRAGCFISLGRDGEPPEQVVPPEPQTCGEFVGERLVAMLRLELLGISRKEFAASAPEKVRFLISFDC